VVRKIISLQKDPSLKAEIENDSRLRAILPETDQRVVQISMTDWEVLTKAAELVNYKLFVRFNTVYLVSSDYLRKSSGIRYIYNARKSDIQDDEVAPILSFYPRLGFEDQRKTVEVIGWDAYKEKDVRYSRAELENVEKDSDLKGYTEISVIASEKVRINQVARTDKQARELAEAELRRRAEQLVRGDLTIIGHPEIELGEILDLKINAFGRIGRQFSGEHQVVGIKNILSSTGYTTEIDINRQGLTEVA
jgi:phage protein D